MKVLLFDPSAGASGDMIMASLLDLGADLDAVRQAVESVGCTPGGLPPGEEPHHGLPGQGDLGPEIPIPGRGHIHSAGLQPAEEKPWKTRFAALDTLAEAESRVHGVAAEQVRFHEIGALDALADIAGACAARHSLAAERVFSRPVSVGGGYVQSAHGLLAVPGPAALEILRVSRNPLEGRAGGRGAAHPHGRGPAGNSGR